MAKPRKRPLTEEERDRRRAEERETARRAVEALTSSAGWQQWLSVRRSFRSYSLANQLLIAMHVLTDGTSLTGLLDFEAVRLADPCLTPPGGLGR